MAGQPLIEIREWGRAARRRVLDGPLLIGRDGAAEALADNQVSRHHLRLVPTPTALSAVDLGSRNGTTVNGVTLTGRRVLATGDVVRLGRTEIVVLHTPTAEPDGQPALTTAMFARDRVAPPPPAEPTGAVRLANRVLGIDPTDTRDPFPSFAELPARIPLPVWQGVRFVSIGLYVGLIILLFVRPAAGLVVLFQVIVPLLPALFLIAPGLWRDICPLAATNQLPRLLRLDRAATPPKWLRERGYLVAAVLFFGIAGARLAGLDRSGIATGTVLSAVAVAALVGGVALAGKSGWCSSICPLFPLQRAYGRTPFVTVANNHCRPCVGCAKNCYDFRPRSAYDADLADPERGWSAPRKLFVAALPGFVFGFFTLAGADAVPILRQYAVLALFMLVAVGLYFALEALTPVSAALLTATYAAVAINVFYWFAGPVLVGALTGGSAPGARWAISAVVLGATVLWLARTRVVELQYAVHTGARPGPVLLSFPRANGTSSPAVASVVFEPGGTRIAADPGMSLLETAEREDLPLEAGCRMGVCGADPVAVLEGAERLSTPGPDERKTLRRLGCADNTRLACCARLDAGTVRVSLTPEIGHGNGFAPANFDRALVSVVIIGNGVAGVTAADFLRRGHPDCEIHLIGREAHGFYNRMGISRLVYGRSAMQGLTLLPDQWYDEHDVTVWLNTLATRIDLRQRRVHLGTGDALPYDRLVLAMGAAGALPDIEGLRRPGSFVLREAWDALRLRAYAQERGCATAVVAGGGLLGLEAAVALRQLGLRVTVLERGDRLLRRQLDPRCSELVCAHIGQAGIEVRYRAETAWLTGDPAVREVTLKSGERLPCELFLAATGIRPNIELARRAGLPVARGVLVDDRMCTAAPGVYAAGDVAEHRGRVHGLWPIAAEQAEVAAVNALGGHRTLHAETPATILKGVGLELFTAGRVRPEPGDEVIVSDDPRRRSYRRLVVAHGRVVGATVLGHHPAEVAGVQRALRATEPLSSGALAAARVGDWAALAPG